jgi:hypothetical protein
MAELKSIATVKNYSSTSKPEDPETAYKEDLSFPSVTPSYRLHFTLTVIKSETSLPSVEIQFINNSMLDVDVSESERIFIKSFPCSKTQFKKQISAWIWGWVWWEEFQGGEYIPSSDRKKIKSYTYFRAKRIGEIMGGRIFNRWLSIEKITFTELSEIKKIAYRLYQNRKFKVQYVEETLLICRRKMEPYVYNLLKNDLKKYNISMCKYLIASIRENKMYTLTQPEYINLIKNVPNLVRKCKYGFDWRDIPPEDLRNTRIPENRWQWFVLRFYLTYKNEVKTSIVFERNEQERPAHETVIKFIEKLPYSEIDVWWYFKQAYHIRDPYSFKEIHHMCQVIRDGYRIHNDNIGTGMFVRVEGSAMRMLRNAIYNHRQARELDKSRLLSEKDEPLPEPPIKFPGWLENLRIKTKHQLIIAGIECNQCIGSYTNSEDIFIRKDYICAQISRDSLEIKQCYDANDKITKASRKFAEEINTALIEIKNRWEAAAKRAAKLREIIKQRHIQQQMTRG